MDQALISKYQEISSQLSAYQYAMVIIGWDSETEAPKGCFEERSKQIGILSQMYYNLALAESTYQLIEELYKNRHELDDIMRKDIELSFYRLTKQRKIPAHLLVEMNQTTVVSSQIWADAKHQNNFAHFEPILTKVVEQVKQYIKYTETPTVSGYNTLLEDYEQGISQEIYDEFFQALKNDLVPFVKKVANAPYHFNDQFACEKYNIAGQKQITDYLMDVFCFNRNHGLVKESEHPFTWSTGTSDVRITTHYHEDNLTSNIFSVIHELGHATFDRQCNEEFNNTALMPGASMAMHESQSRFYENIIGRSYAFWETHFPKLQSIFPEQLKDVTIDEFYHFVNKVELSFIRIEADELTYPLHIMVRYDIEQMLLNNEITVQELPRVWNKLYKDYLGIDVSNDAEGVLQDVHWSDGSFGYFPTYALGSAYAAQLYYAMQKEIDVDQAVRSGNLQAINDWLKVNVHQYGSSLLPEVILEKATGEKFNPKYYVQYLIEKYTKLYNLS